MTDYETGGVARLLEGFAADDAEQVTRILARCPALDIEAGEPYFPSSLPEAALLLVDAGFAVLRLTRNDVTRPIITCEAGAGRILPPPTQEEVLFGLVTSRVIAIPEDVVVELLLIPAVARTLLRQLAAMLAQKREAIESSETRDTSSESGDSCCSSPAATAASALTESESTSR